ncbi:recombination regulator RecX [Amphibacillus sediminis]|uniref:recombination regulator RecX n=1 Tax=Amphibacillus sediminis TaxID=360185 RepID=UPI00083093F8|nr:recombination regulator RecX [Amphibacillus sediminis]
MFTITKITVQKKQNRYNIFLTDQAGNESYAFSVEEDLLIREGLKKGLKLDQATIESLRDKDNLQKGYSQALVYLGYRVRSVQEMRGYLVEKEYHPEQVTLIINRLISEKLLDDHAFAVAFVDTRKQTSTKGPQSIKRELTEKGVAQTIINQALTRYTFEEQIAKVQKWLAKQSKRTSRQSHRQTQLKYKQTLMQKGFELDVIEQALANANDYNNEEEWNAIVYQGKKAFERYSRKTEGFQLVQKVKGFLYQKGFSLEQIDMFVDQYLN